MRNYTPIVKPVPLRPAGTFGYAHYEIGLQSERTLSFATGCYLILLKWFIISGSLIYQWCVKGIRDVSLTSGWLWEQRPCLPGFVPACKGAINSLIVYTVALLADSIFSKQGIPIRIAPFVSNPCLPVWYFTNLASKACVRTKCTHARFQPKSPC